MMLACGPAFATPAFIVVDADDGTVINHRDSDKLWYPASVTKMMTAYLAFQALKTGRLKTTSSVEISANALAEPPSKMGFKVGTVMTVDNAIKMMLVKSANDIAVAIGEAVGGTESEFVAMMNAEAQRLGMASTRYRNPNGWHDDAQVTTARDLAVLARSLWLDFPEYRHYFAIPAIKHGKRILRSQNTLLERYPGTNGMKTGFTCNSGLNIVASATRNGRTLITVVLGAESSADRAETTARLMNQGFASWGALKRQQLADFQRGPVFGAAVNMRDQVCGKRIAKEEDDSAKPVLAGTAPSSALLPRFVLMEPVVVFTGGTDPAPGGTTSVARAGSVPMPRINPRRNPVEDGTASAFAPSAKLKSPIDVLTEPAPGKLSN